VVDHLADTGVIVGDLCLTDRRYDTLQASDQRYCSSREWRSICEDGIWQWQLEFAKSRASCLDLQSSPAQSAIGITYCH